MKKTLEEAADKFASAFGVSSKKTSFIAGANYQKSITPFSEEDFEDFAEFLVNKIGPVKLEGKPLMLVYYINDAGFTFKELLELYLKNKNK